MKASLRKAQQGFTLIELMIVVAIIGILAAIAIPQYQTYVAKSQVSRVVEESGALKTAVETCMNNGQTTVGAAPNCDPQATGSNLVSGATQVGATLPSNTGVPQVTITPASNTASIVATFGNSAATTLVSGTAKTVTWSRDANGSWTCKTTADAKYAPAGCPSGT